MVILWLLDLAIVVAGWLVALLPSFPVLQYPQAFSLTVPVPYISHGTVDALNVWWSFALPVGLVLILGRLIQWLYGKIPFKAT